MKTLRPYPRLVITKKGTRWTEGGHPWIYEAEVLRTEDASGVTLPLPLENGSLVDVVSESGKYLGTGFLSLQSKIRVRILSRNANDRFDEDFWRRRVRYSLDYPKAVMGKEDLPSSRVIFGEADGFPGLTVDRFNDLLVSEVLSVGIEQRKGLIYRLLLEEFLRDGVQIRGIYERNESKIRELEGLPMEKGWYSGTMADAPDSSREASISPLTEIVENGVHYHVDVENGQKTGFFLDQKYNRRTIQPLAAGRKVLDLCTHTGSFALNALRGGAAWPERTRRSTDGLWMRRTAGSPLWSRTSSIIYRDLSIRSSIPSTSSSWIRRPSRNPGRRRKTRSGATGKSMRWRCASSDAAATSPLPPAAIF